MTGRGKMRRLAGKLVRAIVPRCSSKSIADRVDAAQHLRKPSGRWPGSACSAEHSPERIAAVSCTVPAPTELAHTNSCFQPADVPATVAQYASTCDLIPSSRLACNSSPSNAVKEIEGGCLPLPSFNSTCAQEHKTSTVGPVAAVTCSALEAVTAGSSSCTGQLQQHKPPAECNSSLKTAETTPWRSPHPTPAGRGLNSDKSISAAVCIEVDACVVEPQVPGQSTIACRTASISWDFPAAAPEVHSEQLLHATTASVAVVQDLASLFDHADQATEAEPATAAVSGRWHPSQQATAAAGSVNFIRPPNVAFQQAAASVSISCDPSSARRSATDVNACCSGHSSGSAGLQDAAFTAAAGDTMSAVPTFAPPHHHALDLPSLPCFSEQLPAASGTPEALADHVLDAVLFIGQERQQAALKALLIRAEASATGTATAAAAASKQEVEAIEALAAECVPYMLRVSNKVLRRAAHLTGFSSGLPAAAVLQQAAAAYEQDSCKGFLAHLLHAVQSVVDSGVSTHEEQLEQKRCSVHFDPNSKLPSVAAAIDVLADTHKKVANTITHRFGSNSPDW